MHCQRKSSVKVNFMQEKIVRLISQLSKIIFNRNICFAVMKHLSKRKSVLIFTNSFDTQGNFLPGLCGEKRLKTELKIKTRIWPACPDPFYWVPSSLTHRDPWEGCLPGSLQNSIWSCTPPTTASNSQQISSLPSVEAKLFPCPIISRIPLFPFLPCPFIGWATLPPRLYFDRAVL